MRTRVPLHSFGGLRDIFYVFGGKALRQRLGSERNNELGNRSVGEFAMVLLFILTSVSCVVDFQLAHTHREHSVLLWLDSVEFSG